MNKLTIKTLKDAICDYEQTKEIHFCNYIALIISDYNRSEFNRTDFITYHIIVGDDLKHAVSEFNADISHDNVIDLTYESYVLIDEDL